MLLLRSKRDTPTQESVWTAREHMFASPDEVLRAMTDPDAIAAWAPVSFEVDGLAGSQLRAGSVERVSGSLAGIRTAFEVEVHAADVSGLELVARGPVALEVSYRFRDRAEGTDVEAAVRIRRQRGLGTQVLASAVAALLNAGALRSALRRIEGSLACPLEPELIAA